MCARILLENFPHFAMEPAHNAVLERVVLSINSIRADVQESKQPVPEQLLKLLDSLVHHLRSQPESGLQAKFSETLDLLSTCKWERPTRLQGCLAELHLVAERALKVCFHFSQDVLTQSKQPSFN